MGRSAEIHPHISIATYTKIYIYVMARTLDVLGVLGGYLLGQQRPQQVPLQAQFLDRGAVAGVRDM